MGNKASRARPGRQTPAPSSDAEPPMKSAGPPLSPAVIAVGDPVMDLVSSVSFETLEQLGMHAGGCTSVAAAELQTLLSLEEVAAGLIKVPGGSAANVAKCLAGLRGAAGASAPRDVSFFGMVGQDAGGAEYRAMLEAAGVAALLPAAADVALASAACLCLISPDGQRTMRTYLGAAQALQSPDQIPTEAAAALAAAGLAHFEGYSMFRPAVTRALMSLARTAGARVSLDLASFEVVNACWSTLQRLLNDGLVNVVFCNEDEARALCAAGGLLGEGIDPEKAPADDVVAAAQEHLLGRVGVAVMTRGGAGCVAATATGERATAPAETVPVVDTVGAGDYFSAGFLHVWARGAGLGAAAAAGCAAGAAAVQRAGADLGEAGMAALRDKVQKILESEGL